MVISVLLEEERPSILDGRTNRKQVLISGCFAPLEKG